MRGDIWEFFGVDIRYGGNRNWRKEFFFFLCSFIEGWLVRVVEGVIKGRTAGRVFFL